MLITILTNTLNNQLAMTKDDNVDWEASQSTSSKDVIKELENALSVEWRVNFAPPTTHSPSGQKKKKI